MAQNQRFAAKCVSFKTVVNELWVGGPTVVHTVNVGGHKMSKDEIQEEEKVKFNFSDFLTYLYFFVCSTLLFIAMNGGE